MFMAQAYSNYITLIRNRLERKMVSLMLAGMKTLILSSMVLLALGCTGASTVQITPIQPATTKSLFPPALDTKIKIHNFIDAREGKLDPFLIGRREAAFGVPMGDVYSERPVFEIVTEAVKSGFSRSGYKIVGENEDFSVHGKIRQFWAKTPAPAPLFYWDVVGEVTLTMEVSRPGQKVATILGPYTDRKVERTAINPSPEMMKRVLTAALMSVIQEMSSDPRLISKLTKKQKN
jgi:hypothetical protein